MREQFTAGRPRAPSPGGAGHNHPHRQPALAKGQNQPPQPSAATRHLGCYPMAWRDGFGCGFRDALRLAGRRLPPHTWATLEAIASEFDLAGGDD